MKYFSIIMLFFAVLIFSGCVLLPDPDYTEADDTLNNTTAGAQEITQAGGFYFAGTISSGTDNDYWKITIPASSTVITIDVYHNGKLVTGGLLGISTWPISFTEYDNSSGTYVHIWVAAVGENELDLTDLDYIMVWVGGNDSDVISGDYQVYFYAH